MIAIVELSRLGLKGFDPKELSFISFDRCMLYWTSDGIPYQMSSPERLEFVYIVDTGMLGHLRSLHDTHRVKMTPAFDFNIGLKTLR